MGPSAASETWARAYKRPGPLPQDRATLQYKLYSKAFPRDQAEVSLCQDHIVVHFCSPAPSGFCYPHSQESLPSINSSHKDLHLRFISREAAISSCLRKWTLQVEFGGRLPTRPDGPWCAVVVRHRAGDALAGLWSLVQEVEEKWR